MARRSRPHAEELPFVALMDTLTNVVGVLVIVLVMIGLGLAKAVNKVLSDLPPVTVQEHAALEKAVKETTPKYDPKKLEEEISKLEATLKKTVEELQKMDAQKQDIKVAEIQDIQKKLEECRKERDLKKASVEKLLAEIQKLKVQLDTAPVYVPPPATIVKMPNPRPLPDKATIQHFLISGDRIIYANSDDYYEMVIQEFKTNKVSLILSSEVVKGPDGKPVMQREKSGRVTPQKKNIYDPKKVTDYFARARLTGRNISMSGRNIKVEVIPTANSPAIPVKITIEPTAGETVAQAASLISEFQSLLRKFKQDTKTVVWFHIAKDSILTYLATRELVDREGLPATWDLNGALTIWRNLPPEYSVQYTPPPTPAPTPPSAAPTPTPIIIAPPKATLD